MPIFKNPDVKIPSLKVSLKKPSFDFLKPKPVFNRPVNFRRKAGRVPQWLFIAFLTSLVVFSAAVTGLKASTIHFVEENGNRGFLFTMKDGRQAVLAALPKDLFHGTAKMALITAVISTFTAVGHLAFLICGLKNSSKTQTYSARRNTMFIHIINTILILLSMVAIFVTHKSSSHFSAFYMSRKGGFGKDGFYDRGTFDLETWSCELKSKPGAEPAWEDYASQCRIEESGRWMMVPFLLAGVGVTCLSVAQMMGCQRESDEEQLKTPVEFEMGKFNAI